ncbi:MAG: calcium/proton exchanger [Ktedonobacterales bacterium]
MPQATSHSARATLDVLSTRTRVMLGAAAVSAVLAGVLSAASGGAVLIFVISGAALALLAALVGEATEQLGSRLGPGATGVLQSALGNLPELFVGIFALRAGLVTVVQAALVGSILGNSLLVLGLAFIVGGLKHGTQVFSKDAPRNMATLTLLAVAALVVPTLTSGLHTPAAGHEEGLSVAAALVLLAVFVASIPVALSGAPTSMPAETSDEQPELWPLGLAIAVLVAAGVGSAFVSDWFVGALNGAMSALHLSPAFTGLVIVALAGNAVENVVGIQLAARDKMDYAISVILNSSLQVALGLIPVLVLLSFVVGAHLTLVLPPLLLVALGLSALLGTVITYDGKSTWLEGLALVGLYAILAVSFWWG